MDKYADRNIKIYLVGGSVRDMVLTMDRKIDLTKRLTKDFDFLVEGLDFVELPDYLRHLKKDVIHIHMNFLVIKAKDRLTGDIEDYSVCRKDTYTKRLSLPEITPGTIFEDLERRDFTMNAIAYDVQTADFIDPHHGIRDIEDGVIRCVGDPKERFMQDCVRIIRCFRFHIRYEFKIHESIWECIENNRDDLITAFNAIPKNRIVNELNRMFEEDPSKSILLLGRLDPELLKAVMQDSRMKIRS